MYTRNLAPEPSCPHLSPIPVTTGFQASLAPGRLPDEGLCVLEDSDVSPASLNLQIKCPGLLLEIFQKSIVRAALETAFARLCSRSVTLRQHAHVCMDCSFSWFFGVVFLFKAAATPQVELRGINLQPKVQQKCHRPGPKHFPRRSKRLRQIDGDPTADTLVSCFVSLRVPG